MRVTAHRAQASSSLLLTAALLLPTLAWAGGMEVGDIGAEALGRGGAFVAKADNPAAINYNPAGFVKLRGHHITVGGNAVHSIYNFTRLGDRTPSANQREAAGGSAYPTIGSTTPWFAAPRHMMVTTDLGIFDRVTFAGGFYVPSAAGGSYAAEIEDAAGNKSPAPQRYDLVSMGGLILFPSVAVAFRPVDWIDVGLSFQWVVSSITATNYGTVGTACDQAEDPGCDLVMDIEAQDLFAPTGSAGVLLRPSPNFELGGLLRLPSKSVLKGTASVTIGSALKQLESYLKYKILDPEKPEVTITNSYPLMIRLGARYIFRDGAREVGDIEANVIFENWAAVSERVITVNAKSLNADMPPTVMDSKLKNTFGLRVGGSYRFLLASNLELTLRAGAFGETESTAVSDTSLGTLGPKRIGLTSGVGVRWGRFSLDAAYAHIFIPSRVVNQSTVTAMDFGGDVGPVVGNGTYTASVDMFSGQFSVAFGLPDPPRQRRETTPPIKERVEEEADDDFERDEDEDHDPLRNKGRPAVQPPPPVQKPRDPNGLYFDAEVLTRKPAKPAPKRTRRARRGRRDLPVDDELDQLMGKKPRRTVKRRRKLSMDDELDEMMGKRQRRKVRRSKRRQVRKGKRYRRSKSHRRYRRAKRWAKYRRSLRKKRRLVKRRRFARRNRRCIRRDHTGLCVRYARRRR